MIWKCRDCVAWRKMSPIDGIRREIPTGLNCCECNSEKNNQIYEGLSYSSDLWITGADFGCVHFVRKKIPRSKKLPRKNGGVLEGNSKIK